MSKRLPITKPKANSRARKRVPANLPKRKRKPGSPKGKLLVEPEFFDPLPATELLGWG